jgi:predicted RNA binding protein YcfA (HicA-like mRNA interferase family)
VAQALRRAGFDLVRQRGSHARFAHSSGRRVTVPMGSSTLRTGTLATIVSQAGLSAEEFIALLR